MIIRHAYRSELPAIIALTKATFSDYPLFVVTGSGQKRMTETLDMMFEVNTRANFRDGNVFVMTTEDDTIIAAYILQSPAQRHHTIWDYLRAGLWRIAFRGQWRLFKDILTTVATAMADMDKLPRPLWYLDTLMVSPQFQGQRIGSRALHEGIIPYIASHGGGQLALITNTAINCKFYIKNGFTETSYRDLRPTRYYATSVPNWTFAQYIAPTTKTTA